MHGNLELKIISQVPESNLVEGEDIVSLIWNNGKLLTAINTKDNRGLVKVWTADLQLLYEVYAHEYPIYHMVAGNSSEFFTSASDSTIYHWEDRNGKLELLDILRGHQEPAWRLKYCGNRLYSGDATGEVRMWENGELVGCLGTVEDIWDMIIHDDVLYTTRHRDVYLTNFRSSDDRISWSIKNTIEGTGPLFIMGDEIYLMSRSTYEILVHSLTEQGNPLKGKLSGHQTIVNAVVGNSKVLYSGSYDGTVVAWNLDSLTKICDIKLQGCINSMAIDPQSEIVYVGCENRFIGALKLQ